MISISKNLFKLMIDTICFLISMLIYCLKIILKSENIDLTSIIEDNAATILKLKKHLKNEKFINAKIKAELNLEKKKLLDLKLQNIRNNIDHEIILRAAKGQNIKLRVELEKIDVEKMNIQKCLILKELKFTIDNLLSIGINKNDYSIKYYNAKFKAIYSYCSICQENITSIYCDPCGHTYCNKCIKTNYNCNDCKSVLRLCDI